MLEHIVIRGPDGDVLPYTVQRLVCTCTRIRSHVILAVNRRTRMIFARSSTCSSAQNTRQCLMVPYRVDRNFCICRIGCFERTSFIRWERSASTCGEFGHAFFKGRSDPEKLPSIAQMNLYSRCIREDSETIFVDECNCFNNGISDHLSMLSGCVPYV